MGHEDRKAQLKEAATTYFAALANKDFDMIPYEDNVVLCARSPPAESIARS